MLSKIVIVAGCATLAALPNLALASPKSQLDMRNARETVVTYELNDQQIDAPGLGGLRTLSDSKSADASQNPAGGIDSRQLADSKGAPR